MFLSISRQEQVNHYLIWLLLMLSIIGVDTWLTISFPAPYEEGHVFSDNGARFQFELVIFLALFSFFRPTISALQLIPITVVSAIFCYLEIWDSVYFFIADLAEDYFEIMMPQLPRYGVIIMSFVASIALVAAITKKGFSVLRGYCLIVLPLFLAFIFFAHAFVAQPIMDRLYASSTEKVSLLASSASGFTSHCEKDDVICYSGKISRDVGAYQLGDFDIADISGINSFAFDSHNVVSKSWVREFRASDDVDFRKAVFSYWSDGSLVRIIIDNNSLKADREFSVMMLGYLLTLFGFTWVMGGITLMLFHQIKIHQKD